MSWRAGVEEPRYPCLVDRCEAGSKSDSTQLLGDGRGRVGSDERRARKRLSRDEVNGFIDHIAANPDDGESMSGTGGARKVRWATQGRGKSGSVRVITFYSGPPVPVFLLTVFGKGEKSNLTDDECNELRKMLKTLVKRYQEGVKERTR